MYRSAPYGRSALTLAALLAAGSLLTACAGADSADSARSAKPASAGRAEAPAKSAQAPAGSAAEPGGSGNDAAHTAKTAARVLPARDIIYRGNVTVRVKNVTSAAQRAEVIVRAVGGEVFSEQTESEGRPGSDRAHLTLRVPPEQFRPVMARLGQLGKRLRQAQTAQDVTTQVVDTESRIASQRRSVARVRALLDQATNIGQVVQVEAELSRREADLESLEAQLERLKDVTQMATIELDLVGTYAPAPKVDEDDELGFFAGFRGGWEAFVQIVLVGLTVVGALLPFALTTGLIGVPLWLVLRSRLRRRPAAVAPEAPAA